VKGILAYERWYKGYAGKNCKGRKCPHYGTEMLEREDLQVCPMHGLTVNAKSLIVIERESLS
jgi:hypothetical protein